MSELIDAYMAEVRARLPKKQPQDLEMEIRSLIEDTVDGRCKAEGREADEELVVEVLRTFGPPEKMVASYLPERYLVGPQLFPTFLLVMRITLIVVAVIALVQLGISLGRITSLSAEQVAETLAQTIADLAGSALQILGNVVLIFAVLQALLPQLKLKDDSWDPRTLKGRTPADQLKVGSLVWDAAWMAAALLLFNFYPEVIAVHNYNSVLGEWSHVPVLAPAFFTYLPALNLVWVLGIGLNIVLLRRGRWEPATRWVRVSRTLLLVVTLGVMAGGPAILRPASETLPALGWSHDLDDLVPQIAMNARLLLLLIAVLEAVDLFKCIRQWGWLRGRATA